jgi:fibronectin-binding autotransporter adhesin
VPHAVALARMALIGASLMMATAAQAQSVWGVGTTNTTNYNLDSNWGPATSPVGAGQSAVFKNNGKANINVTAGPISPDSWTFNANSKSFTITGADVNFSLAGANGGIINKANSGQTISISNNIGETLGGVRVQQSGNSTLILSGANTYTGNTTISAGTLQVTNSTPGVSSSVGTGNVVLNGGVFQADGLSDLKFDNRFRINTAGGAIDANGIALTLSGKIVDGAGAGPLTILDSSFGGGRVIFTGNNTYTGGTTICNCATLQLGTSGNSGSIVGTVTNEGVFNIVNANTSGITTVTNQSGSFMTFRNSTDAGTMTIDNHISASTVFNNASAGGATINNIGGFGVGVVEFNKSSSAGDATINNAGFSYVVFNDQATLAGAKIVNSDAGQVFFYSQSSAGNAAASITNNGQAQTHFYNQSKAGSATITNNDSGVLDFNNRSSADNATIVNSSAIGMAFLNQSTAGNAFITTNNNSATYFFNRSDGGTARFETEAGSIVDFSRSRGASNDGRINAGSIAGAGNYYIGGGNTLVVGGNDHSTEVSGVIADNNPCGCTTGPGALEKAGLGTMILSGTNTYSGGTTISAGTLQLGNGGATGSILGDVVNNGTLAFNRSNTYQFDGVISGSGAVEQNGTGKTILTALQSYGGLTTIAAGTLALTGAGNIASSSGVVANGAFDISGVSGAGTSIQTLSGSGSVTLGAKTLTLTNASGNFAGAIGGSGGLTLAAGTQTLSGVNGYTGATTINGGMLALAGAGSIASSSGVVDNGIFDISGTNSGASIKSLSGSGGVTLGAKTLTLTNASGNFAGAISGSGGVTLRSGAETLSGVNTYTGATMISGGTLTIAASGSITSDVTSNAAFNNSGIVTGAVTNSGAFNNNAGGVVTGLLTNIAAGGISLSPGTTTNNGQLNGGALVSGGTLTNNNLISGDVRISGGPITSTGQLINNRTIIGAVTNAGFFDNNANGTVTGNVTNSGTFNNNAGGIVTGLLTNNAAGPFGFFASTTTNAGRLNGGALVSGGTLTNNNLISGDVRISGGGLAPSAGHVINNLTIIGAVINAGFFDNNANGTVTGNVTNSGTFNNNAGGIVTGLLTNNAAGPFGFSTSTTTNAGRLNGGALVSGGMLTNNNLISGDVRISGGSIVGSGHVDNNLTITGAVTNTGTFNNNTNGTVSGLLINSTMGSTTNAGHLNGGANVAGGMLTTTGTILNGLTNNATVNANGGAINGPIINNANGTFNVGGTVTSDGSFTNNAGGTFFPAGTLAIGASGAYTLQGLLSNSGVVTVAGGGQLIATAGGITNNAGGTITVAAGGTVKDDLNNAGVVTNNGAYIANVASNTGAITNNAVWTGTVSNAGIFNNNAGATLSGLLTNTAGTTVNNGALNGGATISGGTFTGSGTVANLTVSGGIFAPGNGTPGSSMTVAGNLAFQSGAMYLVALNPTTASFAGVGGTATLNGTAAAIYLAGNYVSKKYTILTAAGGVSGTFGSLVNANVPAGFTSSLSYDANNAYINLALNLNPAPNFGSGLNINQQNVANTLVNFFNTTGGIPAVFGSLSPRGLTQASGELATASQQTTFDAMNLFLGLLTDPFVAGRGTGVTTGASSSQFAEESDASAYAASGKPRTKSERDAYAAVYRKAPLRDVYDPRWSVWAAGYGGSQTTDGNAGLGSNNTRSSIGGVAVGADYLFSPRTIAGFALAGGGTSFSVNGLGAGRSDLFQAGAFVRHTNGPAYLSAALAYGWQDVTTDRTVTVAGADLLRARFNANAFSGRVEGGYRFVTPWMAVGLTPYAAGQFTTFDLPAYAEQAIAGTNTFALNYAAKDVTASRSELGLRSDKSFAMQDAILTLRGRAAWAHNFNTDRNIAATFQTLPGASFVVNGAAQAQDSALVTASAEMKWLNGFALAATFEGEFSNVTASYAGKGVARYAW